MPGDERLRGEAMPVALARLEERVRSIEDLARTTADEYRDYKTESSTARAVLDKRVADIELWRAKVAGAMMAVGAGVGAATAIITEVVVRLLGG